MRDADSKKWLPRSGAGDAALLTDVDTTVCWLQQCFVYREVLAQLLERGAEP